MNRARSFAGLLALVLAACSVEGAPPSTSAAEVHPMASPSAVQVSEAPPTASPQVSLVPCPSGGTPEAPITLTAEESLSCELASVAADSGTTIEDEYARYRAGEILGEITNRIAQERPEILVGGALSVETVGPSTLYIKGPADDYVLGLVAAAEIEIVIADNQPFSFIELEERNGRVGTALVDLGFTNFSSGADIRTGRIRGAVTIEKGLPTNAADVVAMLPADLRPWVDLTMSKDPVAVDTIPE